jgi:hypothetical protein
MSYNKSQLSLTPIATFPGFRVLAWHDGYLYAAKGYRLYRMEIGGSGKGIRQKKYGRRDRVEDKGDRPSVSSIPSSDSPVPVPVSRLPSPVSRLPSPVSRLPSPVSRLPTWELVGFYRPDWLRGLASRNRLSSRLLRTGFHAVFFLPSGRIVAILAKAIAVLEPGEKEFKTVWRVKRGTRPMGMAVTPEGWLFWGEYFANPDREEVYVYGSTDEGISWEVVYTFPKGAIRHVHNVLYDPWEDCLWVLTGDEEAEPKIMKADKEWKEIEVVRQGDQQSRAVNMIFKGDEIYYATDTPHEQNRIYRMERATGRMEGVAEVTGPSMWSCKAGGCMFFSTASEPGEKYYPAACLWGSRDGDTWQKLLEWPKDPLHPEYFQFGNIVLPRGEVSESFIATTGIAVKEMDGKLGLWALDDE